RSAQEPEYVADHYEGFDAVPFSELDEEAVSHYLDANVAAVRSVPLCRSPTASRSAISAKEATVAEPNVVDPFAVLGDGGEQSVTAHGFQPGLFAGLRKDALHRRETWRGPGKRDRG